MKEILTAYHHAVHYYAELVELNQVAGEDSALSRAAAESASAIRFLMEIRDIFGKKEEWE